MNVVSSTAEMRIAIETTLKQMVEIGAASQQELHSMLAYHLGWEGQGAGIEAQGKRIRPLLVLLCAEAAGGDWRAALPAAAAVELVHNFSLIHDDIQDQSETRRGRPTVWVQWGPAQAINAGDTMFTLAHLALYRLEERLAPSLTLEAARVLDQACIALTEGQYLDLSYEKRAGLTEVDYWPMIRGKTAALLGGCAELGALTAGASPEHRAEFRQFGLSLGLAFQVWDDWLGIWGDSALTGKSTESDLVSGKKSLPVLYGLGRGGRFAARWQEGPVSAEEVPGLAALLVEEGARQYIESEADRLTAKALSALDRAAKGHLAAARTLRELAVDLLKRKK